MANLTGFKSDNKGLYITKDSQANVVYGLDWTDWLPSGDGLSSAVVTIETISYVGTNMPIGTTELKMSCMLARMALLLVCRGLSHSFIFHQYINFDRIESYGTAPVFSPSTLYGICAANSFSG